jgi:hypothetical protein
MLHNELSPEMLVKSEPDLSFISWLCSLDDFQDIIMLFEKVYSRFGDECSFTDTDPDRDRVG